MVRTFTRDSREHSFREVTKLSQVSEKQKVIMFIHRYGGKIDWHPLVEFGLIDAANQLADEGLLTVEVNSDGVLVSLTENGNREAIELALTHKPGEAVMFGE